MSALQQGQDSRSPLRIGLTGGIASGKSTVARMFSDLGVAVIDSDQIAHELQRPGSSTLAEICAAFGRGILDPQGALDRRRLRALVFEQPAARRRLERIMHPAIRAAIAQRAAAAGGAYQILVIPLLVETGLGGLVDRVLVVDCLPEIQLQRLMQRDGENEQSARRVLAAQAPRGQRISQADELLSNTGSRADLEHAVHRLHERYLSRARGA